MFSGFSKKAFLIIFAAAIFYVALAFYSDASAFTRNFQTIRLELIPLILIAALSSMIIRAFRQYFLLKSILIEIPIKKNIQIYLSGLSMLITPGGAGEVVKSFFIKRNYGFDMSKTIPFVIAERFYDFVGTITLIGITIIFYNHIVAKILFALGIIIIIVVFVIARNDCFWNFTHRKLSKIRFTHKLAENLPSSNYSVKQLSGRRISLISWTLSLVAILMEALSVYLSFIAMGVKFDFFLSSQIAYSSGLLGIISLLPGGLGVTEGSMIAFLASNGVKLAIASSVVLLTRLTTLWFSTIIGFIYVRVIMKKR
ncbi:MAG: lysylphosphatidylglycerol synthase transmembrane domain-containing protein [Nitrosotalea sp.]